MTDFKQLIGIVATGQSLTMQQSQRAFDIMMSGDATPSQMGAFLMALRVAGKRPIRCNYDKRFVRIRSSVLAND